jgi:hypothetical protein
MDSGLQRKRRTGLMVVGTSTRRVVAMKAFKIIFLAVLVFVLVRYIGIRQRTAEFNQYVQEEVSLVRSKRTLKEILLLKAEQNKLPITDGNITISSQGAGLRVSVDYQVPLDLVLFQKDLSFHSIGERAN